MFTLWQGAKGNWNPALFIPVVLGAKGFSLVFDLPGEVRGVAIFALFAIVCGLLIIVGRARREWQEGIWIAGLASLVYGLGMATVLALIKSLLLRKESTI